MTANPSAAAGAASLPGAVLYPVFFASGFAALLYQIVWQRALFTFYGTSMEAVTIVVTAFMLGLGLGGLAGGRLTRVRRVPLPLAFALLELGIGAFGAASLGLFAWAAERTSGAAGLEVGLLALGLVLVPTLLMGATLPLLVAYWVARTGSVGVSVGRLYFVNTLGSAAGAAGAAVWVLGALGQAGSVRLAAVLNGAIAGAVLACVWLRRRNRP